MKLHADQIALIANALREKEQGDRKAAETELNQRMRETLLLQAAMAGELADTFDCASRAEVKS